MDRSKAIFIQICCLVVGLIFYAVGKVFSDIFLIPAVILVIGAMIVGLIFNRCPSCGRWLGRHHIGIAHCPYCGDYL